MVAVFPAGPERLFYNNAVLAQDLNGSRAREAAAAIVRAYEGAGVDRYAIWAHESEQAATAEMTRRGFRVDTTTRAMAMSLDEIAVPRPEIELDHRTGTSTYGSSKFQTSCWPGSMPATSTSSSPG